MKQQSEQRHHQGQGQGQGQQRYSRPPQSRSRGPMTPPSLAHTIRRSATRQMHQTSLMKLLVMSLLAGGLLTIGVLFAGYLSLSLRLPAAISLLTGFGLAAGLFFVMTMNGSLFTEASILLPGSWGKVSRAKRWSSILVCWIVMFVGNLVGAYIVGGILQALHLVPMSVSQQIGTLFSSQPHGWVQGLVAGIFANWILALAIMLAASGRSATASFFPLVIGCSLLVITQLPFSPFIMAYASLLTPIGDLSLGQTLLNTIIPVGIGNIIGATLLVVLPLLYITQFNKSNRPNKPADKH